MTSVSLDIAIRIGAALAAVMYLTYPIAAAVHAVRVPSAAGTRSVVTLAFAVVVGLVLLVAALEVEDWSWLYTGGPGPSGQQWDYG